MVERSIKKGFDGVYSLNNKLWIVDSKSRDSRAQNISHNTKIDEAYNNLKGLLDGTGTTNDIWAEAWHNVSLADVNTNDSIKAILKKHRLSAENHNHPTIDQMNVIPCSTIFARNNNTYHTHSSFNFTGNEHIFMQPREGLVVFHATNKMYIEFLKYLKEAT
ncbi:MAG: hypothetical protein ACRCVW_00515 [Brevinema sp.]